MHTRTNSKLRTNIEPHSCVRTYIQAAAKAEAERKAKEAAKAKAEAEAKAKAEAEVVINFESSHIFCTLALILTHTRTHAC